MAQQARAILAAAALGLQFAVLYAPRAPDVATGGLPLDKFAHVAAFALATWALVRAGVPRGWAVGVMAVHAPISEVVQHLLLPDRSGDPGDVLADLVGVAIGAALPAGRSPARLGSGPD